MDILAEKIVRTRKTHRCLWCLEEIPVGSECLRSECKEDGDFYKTHICLWCWEYVQAHKNEFDDEIEEGALCNIKHGRKE